MWRKTCVGSVWSVVCNESLDKYVCCDRINATFAEKHTCLAAECVCVCVCGCQKCVGNRFEKRQGKFTIKFICLRCFLKSLFLSVVDVYRGLSSAAMLRALICLSLYIGSCLHARQSTTNTASETHSKRDHDIA